MSASYQSIINAIDDAILSWAGSPVNITFKGRSTTYRSLTELTAARTYYSNLLQSEAKTDRFQLRRIKAGGA